jgi:UDP-N-acetylmuramoyl-L-alanyl-D-glutamate--2,6-diaminopimelate ligase
VAQALARGAVGSVVERPLDTDVPQLIVTDGRRAAALASAGVMGFPSDDLVAVGVTGTNGKTTTALLIRDILRGRMRTAVIGTLGLIDESGVRPGTEALTTPGPVQLAKWLRDLVDEGYEAVVLEASSHALEQRRLDGMTFDVAVFTNLSQDHLDYHGDMDAYRAAKVRLVDLVTPTGAVVLNGDEPAWEGVDPSGRRLSTFATRGAADVRAENVALGSHGSSFRIRVGSAARDVRFPLLGSYNVENALAAAAAATAVGCSIDEVVVGLEGASQVPGRLERVWSGSFSVLIDFAHTPAALEGMLQAVRPLVEGRLIVLFGAGGDRDRAKRRPMAEAVARHADLAILTSDNPRTEDPERILDDLEAGLTGASYERIVDRSEAIDRALRIAAEGDTVVLAGKGHETYQVIGTEKRHFDERELVLRALDEGGRR